MWFWWSDKSIKCIEFHGKKQTNCSRRLLQYCSWNLPFFLYNHLSLLYLGAMLWTFSGPSSLLVGKDHIWKEHALSCFVSYCVSLCFAFHRATCRKFLIKSPGITPTILALIWCVDHLKSSEKVTCSQTRTGLYSACYSTALLCYVQKKSERRNLIRSSVGAAAFLLIS